eukprot:1155072-Prymnesium_polylepis.1
MQLVHENWLGKRHVSAEAGAWLSRRRWPAPQHRHVVHIEQTRDPRHRMPHGRALIVLSEAEPRPCSNARSPRPLGA